MNLLRIALIGCFVCATSLIASAAGRSVVVERNEFPGSPVSKVVYWVQDDGKVSAYKVYDANGKLKWKVSVGHFKWDTDTNPDALRIYDSQGRCVEKVLRRLWGLEGYPADRSVRRQYDLISRVSIVESDDRGVLALIDAGLSDDDIFRWEGYGGGK